MSATVCTRPEVRSHPLRTRVAALAWVALALACGGADPEKPASVLAVGDSVAGLRFEDADGAPLMLGDEVARVLFTRDMDGGAVVRAVLDEIGAEGLAAASAVYIADISAMPGMIARMVALPRIRKRPYTTWLDRSGETSAALPAREGQATWLHVEAGRVRELGFAADADAVRAALE